MDRLRSGHRTGRRISSVPSPVRARRWDRLVRRKDHRLRRTQVRESSGVGMVQRVGIGTGRAPRLLALLKADAGGAGGGGLPLLQRFLLLPLLPDYRFRLLVSSGGVRVERRRDGGRVVVVDASRRDDEPRTEVRL